MWVATGDDVAELDAFTARVLRRVRTRYPFPLELGVSDGAVWVTSVENGFVAGALTRIPVEPWRRASHALVFPRRPTLALAVGSGVTWVLVGPWASLRLVGVDQRTRRASSHAIRHDVGWIAADNTGLTAGLFGVAGDGDVLRIAPDGSTQPIATVPHIVSSPAVGLGSVWVPSRAGLHRVEARSGRVQGRIDAPPAAAEVTLGGGFVWVLRLRRTLLEGQSYELLKIHPARMEIVARTRLLGSLGGLSFGNGALWIGRSGPSVGVLRIEPRTLRSRLFATFP